MREEALGLVEVIGKLAAIEAADTGLKSANVSLIGIENATGAYLTVKFSGDVGAVKAAVDAAKINAERVGTVVSVHVIPRLAKGVRDTWMKPVNSEDEEKPEKEFVEIEPESDLEIEEISDNGLTEKVALSQNTGFTCNLCKDPKCPREKGQPGYLCIHAESKRGK